MSRSRRVEVEEIKRIKVEGFSPQGDELLELEISPEDADLDVFRKLAGLSGDDLLLGAFPLSDEAYKRVIQKVLDEAHARKLQMSIVFGEYR